MNISSSALWSLFTGETYPEKCYRGGLSYPHRYPWVSAYLKEQGFVPVYPEGYRFAVLVSHDIDFLSPPMGSWAAFKKMGKALSRLQVYEARDRLSNYFSYLNKRNYMLDELMDFLIQRGICSTFFFMALNPQDYDYKYSLSDLHTRVHDLRQLGYEIALHGSSQAYSCFNQLNDQVGEFYDVLSFKPKGYRNHLLNYDLKHSPGMLQRAGFKYDASLGFTNEIGFRNGLCIPFNPFNEEEGHFWNLLEIPMNIMDVSGMGYMGLNKKEMVSLGVELIKPVTELGGVISLLWHHNQFNGLKRSVLTDLLLYIKDQGGWITTHRALIEYWEKMHYAQRVNKELLKLAP